MAPRTRNDPRLERRISRLRLSLQRQHSITARTPRTLQAEIDLLNSRLHPLYPQPFGPPHPKFPKTILHWLLLTEDELDDIAHYYSQSTPNSYTNSYPAPMGWDTEFLARNDSITPQMMPWDEAWLEQFGWLRRDSQISHLELARSPTLASATSQPSYLHTAANSHRHDHLRAVIETPILKPVYSSPFQTSLDMSTAERIAIKRRKLGKFMGLRGCETPVPEMERRIEFLEDRIERAVQEGVRKRHPRDDDSEWEGDRSGGPGPRGPRIGKDLL